MSEPRQPLTGIEIGLWIALAFVVMFGVMSLLGGCTTPGPTPEPVVRTVTVNVPVAVSCVPAQLADAPDYPDSDTKLKAAQDAAERLQLVVAGRTLRIARLGEVEPVVAACRTAAQGH